MGFQSLQFELFEKTLSVLLLSYQLSLCFDKKILLGVITPYGSVLQMFLECVNQETTATLKFQEQVHFRHYASVF